MLNGLADEEMDSVLDEHPTIVPLFEIHVLTAVEPYLADTSMANQEAPHEPNPEAVKELGHACECSIGNWQFLSTSKP